MARITVEDCLENVENRFDLVLKASERARALSMGTEATLPWENDKPTVMALREIAAGTIRTRPLAAAEHFDLPGLKSSTTTASSEPADASKEANMAAAMSAFNLTADDETSSVDEDDAAPRNDDLSPSSGDA